jgi:hypothetical protein
VLIATDRETSNRLFQETRVKVSGEFVAMPQVRGSLVDPEKAWRGMADCPLLQESRTGANRHPLFAGLQEPSKVATNKPSYFSLMTTLSLATLPVEGTVGVGNARVPIWLSCAIANEFPQGGRLLVMADHSVFINDMLLQPADENDNWKFAENVIGWLTDNGKRTQILFCEDSAIRTDFNAGLQIPEPRLPPIEALVPMVNQMLAGLERENAFNQLLVQAFGNLNAVMRTTLLVLTMALLGYGLYRVLNARHRVEPKVPRLPAQLTALATPLPAQEQRHQAVLARGNLSEAARELTRQAFTALGVPPAAGTAVPEFTVDGSWWQRRVWGRRVRQLWELAALGHGRRVSPKDLERMAADLHALRAAAAGGKLHFAATK